MAIALPIILAILGHYPSNSGPFSWPLWAFSSPKVQKSRGQSCKKQAKHTNSNPAANSKQTKRQNPRANRARNKRKVEIQPCSWQQTSRTQAEGPTCSKQQRTNTTEKSNPGRIQPCSQQQTNNTPKSKGPSCKKQANTKIPAWSQQRVDTTVRATAGSNAQQDITWTQQST